MTTALIVAIAFAVLGTEVAIGILIGRWRSDATFDHFETKRSSIMGQKEMRVGIIGADTKASWANESGFDSIKTG